MNSHKNHLPRPSRLLQGLAVIIATVTLWYGLTSSASFAPLAIHASADQEQMKRHVALLPVSSFVDDMASYDTSRWFKANGWKNGSPFDNGWRADHITHANNMMTLTLDDDSCPDDCSGEPYASGEYRTTNYYGYGCYEARFQAAPESGVVTSFFTFAGPSDISPGGNGQHNEIDIEILGNDTTRMQANFWTNDDAYANGHEQMIDLGFDAAAALHNYGFKWTSSGLEWYVDGQLVHSVTDSPSDPTPKETDGEHKIMVNMWPVDATASG